MLVASSPSSRATWASSTRGARACRRRSREAIGEQFLPDAAGGELPADRARRACWRVADKLDTLDHGVRHRRAARPDRATRTGCAAPPPAWSRSRSTAGWRSPGRAGAPGPRDALRAGRRASADRRREVGARSTEFVLDRVDAALEAEGIADRPGPRGPRRRGRPIPWRTPAAPAPARRRPTAASSTRAHRLHPRCRRPPSGAGEAAARARPARCSSTTSELPRPSPSAIAAARPPRPGALAEAAELRAPVDAFFDAVLVMATTRGARQPSPSPGRRDLYLQPGRRLLPGATLMTTTDPIEVHLISDSTGDTAARVARAAQAQFSTHPTGLVRHPRVTTIDGLSRAFERIGRRPARRRLLHAHRPRAAPHHRPSCAPARASRTATCSGPPLEALDAGVGRRGRAGAGPAAGFDEDYFKRVAAMEFAVKHDDGLSGEGLEDAEIVLIGVSRTGKTPLSMYLGYLGYKTANVPLGARHPAAREPVPHRPLEDRRPDHRPRPAGQDPRPPAARHRRRRRSRTATPS